MKKLFSFFLGSLMLVTGTNVLAKKKDINVCVIGDRISKEKFINNVFDENIREQLMQKFEDKKVRNIIHTVNYEDYFIKFRITKFTPNDRNREKINRKALNSHSVIIIPIDIDAGKNFEKVTQFMSYITHYVCEKKNEFTQILIVLCSDDISKYDIRYLARLIGFTISIESNGFAYGWGKNRNRHFNEQFLSSCCAPKDKSLTGDFFKKIILLHCDFLSSMNSCLSYCFVQ